MIVCRDIFSEVSMTKKKKKKHKKHNYWWIFLTSDFSRRHHIMKLESDYLYSKSSSL